MNDLTILYYTSNIINDIFANNVRNHLLQSSGGEIPIISVSQKPIEFGDNLCVLGLTPSIYNIYVQILMGAKLIKTKYTACCEDDCLYVSQHFEHRSPDAFAYNVNRWNVDEKGVYFYRHRRGMCMCIAPTDLLVSTIETRLAKYSDPTANIPHFGEPGRWETRLGLPEVKLEEFETKIPCLHFNHRDSQGSKRQLRTLDIIYGELDYWGSAKELWNRIHG